MKILIVDDEEKLANALAQGLKLKGYTVDVLYDVNGIAIQVHGYINLDRGQGTDVYLRGRALEDYLKKA